MQVKDILLIAPTEQSALRLRQLLFSKGITSTITTPCFTKTAGFELFSHQLSTHRFVATLDGSIIPNFRIQYSIREAENLKLNVPDMWVQFGSNIELVRESDLDAEAIAQRILQELFLYDDRPFSKRKQKTFV